MSRYRVTFKPMVYLRAAPATNPATRTSAFLFCTTFSFLHHIRRPPRSAAIPLLVFIFHDVFLLFRRPPRARPSSRLVLRAPSSRPTPPSPHTRGCGRARAILSACSVSFSYCRCFVSVFRCARAGRPSHAFLFSTRFVSVFRCASARRPVRPVLLFPQLLLLLLGALAPARRPVLFPQFFSSACRCARAGRSPSIPTGAVGRSCTAVRSGWASCLRWRSRACTRATRGCNRL